MTEFTGSLDAQEDFKYICQSVADVTIRDKLPGKIDM